MKVFDEDGEYLGEFIEASKEKVEDAFEVSWIWGIIVLLIVAPGWTIFGLVVWAIAKFIKLILISLFKLLKLFLRCLWWLVRLPIYLIFYHEMPEF